MRALEGAPSLKLAVEDLQSVVTRVVRANDFVLSRGRVLGPTLTGPTHRKFSLKVRSRS